ncbi:hypothetical protein VTO42DRAFT_6877 [Malbranchea cinnamomea]
MMGQSISNPIPFFFSILLSRPERHEISFGVCGVTHGIPDCRKRRRAGERPAATVEPSHSAISVGGLAGIAASFLGTGAMGAVPGARHFWD